MNRRRHGARSSVLLAIALVLAGIGLLSLGVYAVGFVIAMGESDGSMAFWLLPFLLYGLAAVGVGTVLAVLWGLLRRLERDADVHRESGEQR